MEKVVDFKDLKTIVCSFDLKEVEKSLSKYNAQDLNAALEEESISPYKHATLDKAKLLVKHGIDVNLSLGNGLKAIGFVNDWDVFKLMVDNGLDFEHGIFTGVNVFATQFNPKILQYIYDKTGVKPDFDNSSSYKIHQSYEYIPYQYDLLKMYLENDFIDKNFSFNKKETLPFYVNDIESLKLMDKYGFDLFHANEKGETILSRCQTVEAFRYLNEEKGVPYSEIEIEKRLVDSHRANNEIRKYLIKEKGETPLIENLINNDEMLDFLVDEYHTPEQNQKMADELYYNLTVEAAERERIGNNLLNSMMEMLKEFNLEEDNLKSIESGIVSLDNISWVKHYLTPEQFKVFESAFADKLKMLSDYSFYGLSLIPDGNYFSQQLYSIAKKYYNSGYLNAEQFEHVQHYKGQDGDCQERDLPLAKILPEEINNVKKVVDYLDNNPQIKSILFESGDESLAFWGFFSPADQEIVESTMWVLESYDPIGLHVKDGYQSYVGYNSDNEFYTLCNYVQDIPLAMLYIERGVNISDRPLGLDDGSEDDFLMAFDEYKHWCQENGLVLDQDGVFLDDNKEFLRTRLYVK